MPPPQPGRFSFGSVTSEEVQPPAMSHPEEWERSHAVRPGSPSRRSAGTPGMRLPYLRRAERLGAAPREERGEGSASMSRTRLRLRPQGPPVYQKVDDDAVM